MKALKKPPNPSKAMKTMTDFSQNASAVRAAELLRGSDGIAILCHINPDGDTIGSAYALAGMLEQLGKSTCVLCAGEIPAKYDYARRGLKLACETPQTVVAADVATSELLGALGERFAAVDLLIDHHGAGTDYARLTVRDAAASSTTVLMLRMAGLLGVTLTPQMADALFTGLVTDTGCFRYSNTNAEAHLAAVTLMEAGAAADEINKLMFETKSRAEMDFTRLALDTLEYFCDGKVAVMSITDEMRARSGFFSEELGEIPQFARRVEGVICGITLKQKSGDTFKVSLRTNSEMDATVLAAKFGGGGHVRAAGCTLHGDLASVRDRLVAAAGEMLR